MLIIVGKKKPTNEVNSNRILLRVSYIFIKGNVISKKKKKPQKKNQYIVAWNIKTPQAVFRDEALGSFYAHGSSSWRVCVFVWPVDIT